MYYIVLPVVHVNGRTPNGDRVRFDLVAISASTIPWDHFFFPLWCGSLSR